MAAHVNKKPAYWLVYRQRKFLRGLCIFGGCHDKALVLTDRKGNKRRLQHCDFHSSSYNRRKKGRKR